MDWRNHCYCFILLSSFACVSTSTSISNGIFVNQVLTGRNLLQAKKACPMSFEFQNYTILTSQCKGPQYPAKQCCDAFLQFACPFAKFLNDVSNDCTSTMFSYINLHEKYPPGLFSSECKDTKQGLNCPAPTPSQSASGANSSQINNNLSLVQMIATAFIGVLLLLL